MKSAYDQAALPALFTETSTATANTPLRQARQRAGGLAARSVNILFQVCLLPSRLRAPRLAWRLGSFVTNSREQCGLGPSSTRRESPHTCRLLCPSRGQAHLDDRQQTPCDYSSPSHHQARHLEANPGRRRHFPRTLQRSSLRNLPLSFFSSHLIEDPPP